ncbi:MAG: HAD family hydrolase [Salinispira sp.]
MLPTHEKIAAIFRSHSLKAEPIPVTEDLGAYAHVHLPPQRSIKAIIFDIYGTLFISSSGDISLQDSGITGSTAGSGSDEMNREHALHTVLGRYNISADPQEIAHALRQAIIVEHTEKKAAGIPYPEVDIRNVWRGIGLVSHMPDDTLPLFAAEYESVINPVAPMPGLRTMLSSLINLRIPLGIVSNAQFYTPALFHAFLEKSPEQLGFHPNLLIYSFQEGQAKPSALLYNTMAKRLSEQGISPKETLYIGNDMLNDIWAASQAGFRTVLFAGDQRSFRPRTSDPRCRGLKADYVIDTLDNISVLCAF